MAVFDTPINANDASFQKILKQPLPVLVYLYQQPNAALDQALNSTARETVGELLFVRISSTENPETYAYFDKPALPALVTLDEGVEESRAERILPADVEAHVDFLLGQGPKPMQTAAEERAKERSGAAPVHINDQTFTREVLQSDVPVLVDFWAPWCGPCHMVAPVLERLAEQYAGQIKVAKINVDENRMAASQYRASSIPMLLMFKGGQPVGQLVGAHPQGNIEQLIRQTL